MPSLKLTYFDSPGRAEPIRVALFMVGLPFEDHRLKFPQYMESKARGDFPLGAVPVLEVDGVKFTQTAAMLRYVARIGGALYPADALAALRVDSALDTFNDTLSHALLPSLFERDPAKKLAMRTEFAAGPMKLVLAYAEGLLAGSDGPFFGGQELSIADLVAALQVLQIRSGTLDGITADMLSPYPRLNALADAYLADERVIAYRSR
jgi:glutathione S-transferase